MSLTYNEAVEQTITAGEQIHQIVNGTAITEVTVEDGSKVPSIRKALLDNFYFKDPIAWRVGQTENVFNQLRKFTDGSWWYAPSATASNPISMGSTPVGDSLWKIYDFDAIGKLTPQIRESLRRSYAEAGYNLVDGSFEAGGTLVNANDVLLQERTGKAFSGPAGTYPAGTPTSGFVDESGKTATRKITTVAEIATGKWPVGTQLEVKGRGGAHFEVLAGGTPNGFDILDAGNGNTAVLVFTDATTAVSYGLSSTRSDNQVPIQAMIDHVGYFKLPRGSFDINDEILHKGAARSLGSVWSGAGKESSVLNCVGMSGKSGIRTSADHYVRVEFKDFTIRGDVDHAINLNQATKETYQTKFTRLWLRANLDTCKVSTPFSVEFDGVDASSENGHCFSTRGGNTVLFKSCYAHGVGEGMAGYRVQGRATLINCNGIEEVTGNKYWGWFGDKVNNFAYQITTINCNAEDFGTDGAIRCENFGILVLNGQTFVARSSGTYDNLVNFETLSGNNRIYIDAQTSFASKGAAISGNAGIKANGLKFGLNLSGSPVFQNYYNSQLSRLYPMPTIDMKGSEFGVSSLGVNNFDASANYSFETPVVATWTANAATYDGTGKQVIKTVNTVATSITNCTGLREGTELKILIKDANTTIKHLTGGSGKFRMLSGADVVAANGAVYMFVANGAEWVQV